MLQKSIVYFKKICMSIERGYLNIHLLPWMPKLKKMERIFVCVGDVLDVKTNCVAS